MARFFTSPKDLVMWLKKNAASSNEAATKLINIIGDESSADIAESTRRIFAGEDVDGASTVLFRILSSHSITEGAVKTGVDKGDQMVALDALEAQGVITASKKSEMVKEAQIMRQPGEYPMELRVCPKLLKSAGGRLISTYNCRHYCLDGIVLDEDPERVYCGEAMWRQHVMDKFSNDWVDPKTGDLVGGYINNRFYKFPKAGTPDNPDVPTDHGNKMNLGLDERSRQARPHEFSTERRLEEQRKKGSTASLVLSMADDKIVVTAEGTANGGRKEVSKIFSEAISLHNSGVAPELAVVTLCKKYAAPIEAVAWIQQHALEKFAKNNTKTYEIKVAQVPNRWLANNSIPAMSREGKPFEIQIGTVLQGQSNGGNVFEIVNPNGPTGQFVQINSTDFSRLAPLEDVQAAANEVGLTEPQQPQAIVQPQGQAPEEAKPEEI